MAEHERTVHGGQRDGGAQLGLEPALFTRRPGEARARKLARLRKEAAARARRDRPAGEK